jgi:hypothetical protein
MQTNWTTKDAEAVQKLADAVRVAIATYEWMIGDHPDLDPDENLPMELEQLKSGLDACRRRKLFI